MRGGLTRTAAVDDAQEQPAAGHGDERAAAVDDALASLLAARQATGEPRVDAALAKLDDLAGMPVTEHRAVFEDVHRRLRDVLGELDAGQLPDAEGAENAGEDADQAAGDPHGEKIRLDAELVRRGLARSREQAADLIAAGRVAVTARPRASPPPRSARTRRSRSRNGRQGRSTRPGAGTSCTARSPPSPG